MESGDQTLQRAIVTISQSDPLTKLLEQVKLGRMKPTDAGLRAVTDSWLGTYRKIIESGGFSRPGLAPHRSTSSSGSADRMWSVDRMSSRRSLTSARVLNELSPPQRSDLIP